MSTEDQNKAVVTLKKGVDVDAFIEDMVSGKNHSEFMPGRVVELFNEKPGSKRNVDFVLTREEANNLKNDPRIVDVRYGTKIENGIILSSSAIDPSGLQDYSKTSDLIDTHRNWGIPACTNATNPFVTTELEFTHTYPLAGKGVDVVIMDSGILPGHPEWIDGSSPGTTRLNQINWPTAAGLSGSITQSPNHYTDTDGHGTHTAGTAAGRLYGWAKEANIYAVTVIDNAAAFGISEGFNLIRGWHNNKTNGNPTVVNMSWGYFKIYENITGGNYRGTPWTSSSAQPLYGMVQTIYNRLTSPTRYYHPVRVASVDADIEDCIDDGIILIGAAGNAAHKIDIVGGDDYNNSYTNSVDGTQYYHRGGTPSAYYGVVTVGSVKVAQPEGKSFFSNSGPGTTVWAPGESIMSAIPEGSTKETAAGGSVNHPSSSSFKITKLSGTSMAAPQVTGVISCLLESRKNYTQSDVNAWILETKSSGRLSDTGGVYTDLQSLQGSGNYFLRQPFTSSTAWRFTG
jgi:subtilisin family serine protease